MLYIQTGERSSSVVCVHQYVIQIFLYNTYDWFLRTAYQSLHKVSSQARHYNYIANNGLTHSWLDYYRNVDIRSNQIYINEWNQMDDISSHRSDSPHLYQP